MHYQKNGQFPATHDATAAFVRQYGITDFTSKKAKRGIENSTLILTAGQQNFVLRVYRQKKKLLSDIELEIAFMRHLKQDGLPVPAIIANQAGIDITTALLDGEVWAGILMEFIPGRHAESYSETLLHQLAVYQARMHLEGLGFAQHVSPKNNLKVLVEEEFSPHVPDVALQNDALKAFVERAKSYKYEFDINLPYGFSHFDYDTGNVLVNNDEKITGILDFDDLTYAPVVMCLGYTLWEVLFTTGSIEMARQYIVMYETIRPLSEVEKQAIPHILLFRHYAIGCMDILRGTIDENLQKFLELEHTLISADFNLR